MKNFIIAILAFVGLVGAANACDYGSFQFVRRVNVARQVIVADAPQYCDNTVAVQDSYASIPVFNTVNFVRVARVQRFVRVRQNFRFIGRGVGRIARFGY